MLNSKRKQFLKALAHPLKPVVMIGKKGMSDNLSTEVEQALNTHELIKIKFLEPAFENELEVATLLCQQLEAECVDKKGHIFILFKAHPTKPTIKLPK